MGQYVAGPAGGRRPVQPLACPSRAFSGYLDDYLDDPDLRESWLLRAIYPFAGSIIPLGWFYKLATRLEGGEFRSRTLRRLLHENGVVAEAYSYGAFHEPLRSPPGLRIGRYASIARLVRWGHNHPSRRAALSPVFYLPEFGVVREMMLAPSNLEISADAWIGEMVVITTGCRRIGIGAIIGAGSVVTHDIPDFAIAYGAPARVHRYRFEEPIREALLQSRWWELSPRVLTQWTQQFLLSHDDPSLIAALQEIEQHTRMRVGHPVPGRPV